MNLYFRLLRVLIQCFFKPKMTSIHDTSVLHFRVWPTDMDFNIHLNNGRYLTIMDLGRIDLMFRMGILKKVVQEGWAPLVGTAVMTFRRPIGLFQRYTLKTKIAFWDEKWIYIRQEFYLGETLCSIGYVKGCLGLPAHRGKGTVPVQELLAMIHKTAPQPEIEEDIQKIFDLKASHVASRRR